MAQQAEKTSVKSDKNRLQFEQSPYLLQHADNPVDWYTWGEKAFAAARRENKPVFLSIGYSTCHWCHVMEHESFEDPEVAALMNEIFINIKYVLLGEKHTSCQAHIPRHAGFRGPDLL
ncbi:MAG: DUF255 domain-containing protein [Chloroflexi bacterium]|nr:DUF255 domain-containing protein [Chloroflexota bacterium]